MAKTFSRPGTTSLLILVVLGLFFMSSASANDELFSALVKRDYAQAQELIMTGADPNAVKPNGTSALELAMRGGGYDAAVLLVEKGANPNLKNSRGELIVLRALTVLLRNDRQDVLLTLIDNGLNLDEPGQAGMTILFHVSVEASEWLLTHGADVNARDIYGHTALMMTARSNNNSVEKLELLLKHGADVSLTDQENRTALHDAASSGNLDGVSLLLGAGADPAVQSDDGYLAFHYLATQGQVTEQRAQIMSDMIEMGIDPDAPFMKSGPALIFTNAERSEILLKLGADPDSSITLPAANRKLTRQTPLMRAAVSLDADKTRVLLKHGADPAIADASGCDALCYAKTHFRLHRSSSEKQQAKATQAYNEITQLLTAARSG